MKQLYVHHSSTFPREQMIGRIINQGTFESVAYVSLHTYTTQIVHVPQSKLYCQQDTGRIS